MASSARFPRASSANGICYLLKIRNVCIAQPFLQRAYGNEAF